MCCLHSCQTLDQSEPCSAEITAGRLLSVSIIVGRFRSQKSKTLNRVLPCASAGGAPEVHEDYVVVPGAEDASPGGGGGLRRGVLAEPPQGAFPSPAARLTLRNFKVGAAQ